MKQLFVVGGVLCLLVAVVFRGNLVPFLAWNSTDARLFAAASSLDTEDALAALAAGANPDGYLDTDGTSALIAASAHGASDLVERLLDAGASIDRQQEEGWTALMLASFMGHAETVQKLLGRGASIDLQAKSGRTALMMACASAHLAAVSSLLDEVANADLRYSCQQEPCGSCKSPL